MVGGFFFFYQGVLLCFYDVFIGTKDANYRMFKTNHSSVKFSLTNNTIYVYARVIHPRSAQSIK